MNYAGNGGDNTTISPNETDTLCGHNTLKEKLNNPLNPYEKDDDTWHIINQFWDDHKLITMKEIIEDKELIFSEIFSNIPDDENLEEKSKRKGEPIDKYDCIMFELSPPLSEEEHEELINLGNPYITSEDSFDIGYCPSDGILIIPIKYCVNLPKENTDINPFAPDKLSSEDLYDQEIDLMYDEYDKTVEQDNMDASNILTDEKIAEIKLAEYDRIKYSDEITPYIIEAFDKHINEILLLINNTNYLMNQSEKEDIMKHYNTLMNIQNDNYRYFRIVGPKPISLQKEHLLIENPGSIYNGYVVTEKADGIRAQLMVTKDKKGYLLTQKKEILDIGYEIDGIDGEWVFDGEYIQKDRNGGDIKLFMIFDVYCAADGATSGETYPSEAYLYPWLSKNSSDISRSKILNNFQNAVTFKESSEKIEYIRIGFKNYLETPKKLSKNKETKQYKGLDIFGKVSKKILDLDKLDQFEYSIDGLIYMPMYSTVGGDIYGASSNNINDTW
jgi:hypothetical protein